MKKIVLLGDSMRGIGYGYVVPGILGEGYEVWQPEENCRFASYTLRMLFEYKDKIQGADVIHFNCGAWDICDLFGDGPFTPYEAYEQTMLRIAGILLTYGKKVIFATTMFAAPTNPHNHAEVIEEYNSRLVPKLREMGVIINDLCALTRDHLDEYIRTDDLIHLTEAGIAVCSEQVARMIREQAETAN